MMERTRARDVMPVLSDEERPAEAWRSQAERLREQGRVGAALLADVRSGAHTADAGAFPGDDVGVAEEAESAVAKLERFGEADLGERVARLADGLAAGGAPGRLLLGVAHQALEERHLVAATDFARGARRWLEAARRGYVPAPFDDASCLGAFPEVEALVERGRLDEAKQVVRALQELAAPEALLTRARVLLTTFEQPFDFRAADYLAGDPDDDAALSTRTLDEAKHGLREIAGHVEGLARSLSRDGIVLALPGLAELQAAAATTDLPVDVHARRSLLRSAWARLSWALAALGATRVGAIDAVVRPRCAMDFVDTFLSARQGLLFDLVEGQAPKVEDDLDRALLEATWGGATLASLDAPLARVWLDETEAALEGLRWGMGLTATPWTELE